MITDRDIFSKVESAIDDALLVAWDGCHKIYLAMDEIEATFFRDNYPHSVEAEPRIMLEVITGWFEDSCPLRFVSAVRHVAEDPNEGFMPLIEQFEFEDQEEEE